MNGNAFVQEPQAQPVIFRLAVVTGVSGTRLLVRFEGEEQARQKACRKLASCTAATGNRVLCAAVSGTWVALGVIA